MANRTTSIATEYALAYWQAEVERLAKLPLGQVGTRDKLAEAQTKLAIFKAQAQKETDAYLGR